VTPSGVAAGLHALLPVGTAARERHLLDAAGRAGLRVHGLHADGYWHSSTPDRAGALVVGYATPPAHGWHRALDALTALLKPGGAGAAERPARPRRRG
jgi:GntR family transcriptional regulator / MocR family aminotransferase